jgi:tetratricopeptide (TPR) repeat protein
MPRPTSLSVLGLVLACSGHRVDPAAVTVPLPAFAVAAHDGTALELQAPWTLTASDGSGLVLTRVDARAVVQGPIAFTELHLYFHNPEDRVREGTFAIQLPPRAAISRFAMEQDGAWMEAELVEKQLARRAYEDFLHRRQDPALLEKAEGNQFTARVFPIAGKADKHLVLSFSQELAGERYTLPLRGLPRTERVDVRLAMLASDGRKTEQVLAERGWQPDRDFVAAAPPAVQAIGAGQLVAAQVRVGDVTTESDRPAAMTILVDTSASRSLGFARTVATLGALVGELRARHGDLPLQVVAFDQETRMIFEGRASRWGREHEQALLARGAAGASDLGQALARLRTPHARIVMFGDAVVTAGAAPDAIVAQLRQLRGVERIDVVLSGGIRDEGLAGQLARAARRPGAVLDVDGGIADVVAALGERMLADLAVDVRGADWVYPRTLASARPGSHAMVYARLVRPASSLDVAIGSQRRSLTVLAGAPALVQRAVAAAEIAELEVKLQHAAPDAVRPLRADIARRSIAARVISSQTSLLVLESEADYARYGIDRHALADILEVGPDGGVVQRHRTLEIALPAQPRPAKQPDADKKRKTSVATATESDESTREVSKLDVAEGYDDQDVYGSMAGDAVAVSQSTSAGAPPPAPPPPPVTASRPSPRRDLPAARPRPEPAPAQAEIASEDSDDERRPQQEAWPRKDAPPALDGELADVMQRIARRDLDGALRQARAWREREPGNVLALIALGETLEAGQDLAGAARAYGSIIDLFPGRADLRRFAGERLERVGAGARELAIDTYRRAVADRPDHLTGHRLLAYALLRAGKHADAFAAILAGLEQKYPDGRFRGGERVLRDDAMLIGAAWAAAQPARRREIAAALAQRGLAIASKPSTRFVLYWETDANDVDFHIQDARGGHAFYSQKQLASGGELYEDVTTGYGPECFAIPGVAKAGPYKLSLEYYSQGPMGYGMGLLQIVRHDGKGALTFEDRPFVIMADRAYVDLGTVP